MIYLIHLNENILSFEAIVMNKLIMKVLEFLFLVLEAHKKGFKKFNKNYPNEPTL